MSLTCPRCGVMIEVAVPPKLVVAYATCPNGHDITIVPEEDDA